MDGKNEKEIERNKMSFKSLHLGRGYVNEEQSTQNHAEEEG